ncbi:MAG TPA: hypothetical protein VLZ75_02770 [Chitinophagales bacterium]|nr:hypothetical protein [Chitinophagales bacterium]
MRKLLLIIAVAGIGFGATSCKKVRSCECVNSNTGDTVNFKFNKGKMGNHKQECERKEVNNYNCTVVK